jgi:ABC-type sugar transport system ATPase subunit
MNHVLLKGSGLKKSYGAVQALRGVDLEIGRNETIALVGDNGAGKSTLAKMISGAVRPTEGSFWFEGREVAIANTNVARDLGIETVYQDLGLCNNLTVSENIYLGRELVQRFGPFSFLATRRMHAEAARVLNELSINVPHTSANVAGLSGGQRQAVALSRARLWKCSLVLLDEPTAALGVQETRRAMDGVRKIRADGASVVLITHSLPMVMEMSDRVIVMRRGEKVGDVPTAMLKGDDIVALITGSREQWIVPRATGNSSRQGAHA